MPIPRSSRLSTSSASSAGPRTPITRSPVTSHILLPGPNKRNSSDSWNSSNLDWEEPGVEWQPEQVLLLTRTLDALPAHLITPFVGSVPPPNLLDKVARGVATAKGHNDWPHSVRSTRIKLLELARSRDQEERRQTAFSQHHNVILEETVHESASGGAYSLQDGSFKEEEDVDMPAEEIFQQTTNTPGARPRPRPLYRQSSMDFLSAANLDKDIQQNETLARLSYRLQRPDRTLPSSNYQHHYARSPNSRRATVGSSDTPPRLLMPTSPSPSHNRLSIASTSSSSSYGSARPSPLRRSTILASAAPNDMEVEVENVFASSGLRNTRSTLKRAPSFGVKSGTAVVTSPKTPSTCKTPFRVMQTHARTTSLSSVSSDEEEKVRDKRAKKARVREPSGNHGASKSKVSLNSSSSATSTDNDLSTSSLSSNTTATSVSDTPTAKPLPKARIAPRSRPQPVPVAGAPASRPRISLQRNPSMFGPELPCPQETPALPSRIPRLERIQSPPASPMTPGSVSPNKTPALSPSVPRSLASRSLRHAARRISFNNMASGRMSPGESNGLSGPSTLGSAFQLA
ncbi:hypothetical protein CONPUDRAFT_88603 [Coniophora puteana RWD-64-598 SS2]|uniref:Uncharacterized protein n=1 Tax=Coniophora puteana (strain RWD-64-598) TaxID=741705 RepID=A0A5M3MYX8_CONPW|nr:uncharacterized protein CONPUDRAFT_88603 [Coniophora puteana RWD-64-598 SS2]EIW84340.1 hypothetical protein CONPUDRAFT_88603 [Coniophora puteana RWD-64-598 SS2]